MMTRTNDTNGKNAAEIRLEDARNSHALGKGALARGALCSLALAAVLGIAGCAGNIASSIQGHKGNVDTEMALSDGYAAEADGGYCGTFCYPNTEEYATIAEHGFVRTGKQPLSTFASDIDTASYCNLRRMISQGYGVGDIPDGAARVEEMLNYFDYGYASPEPGELFGVSAEIADCPWNSESKLMIVGVTASDKEVRRSAGNNFVFLIDVSGSMADENKLDLLQDSFGCLLDNLGDDDTISIVTYASEERIVLAGAKGSERRKIMRAIDSLEAGGSTNGQAGLAMAYEVARENFIEGGNNRIILASDGDLNVGITSDEELSDYVSEMKDSGIYLSVLGFGDGNYKDSKMERIADDGNGAYYYVDCIGEAERIFGEDLQSTLVTVADDAKMQIEFDSDYVSEYRQIGYENREMTEREFDDDRADAGEIGAGCSVTVAYEIVLTDKAQEAGSESDWMDLTIRYKDPGGREVHERSFGIGAQDCTLSPSDDWAFASSVIEFAMVVNDSEFAGCSSEREIERLLERVDARNDPK
ncbi:MAG: von Willebrand factor type A domain-containing protein, partial [Coriobacteriales bacterium]|nr:von Willebrand factor type A domain-containing protein [Coriobacteriales bacterium]